MAVDADGTVIGEGDPASALMYGEVESLGVEAASEARGSMVAYDSGVSRL